MKTIYVKNNGKLMELNMDEVASVFRDKFSSNRTKTIVMTLDGRKFEEASLLEYIDQQEGFAKVDIMHYANLNKAERFDPKLGRLTYLDGSFVNVSRTRTKEVQELFLN